jgi:mannitol/fructose-specific phosphotransferase system IIA component (Ntr-type)
VALGQSRHLREQTRTTLDQFVSFIFAPIFFASIGLKVNFVTHFDLGLTLIILALAITGKVSGSALGGRLGGLPWREAWGVGVGMCAQGTMGIILGVLALQIGLISQKVFVALVIMALLTSLASGPLLQWILRLKKPRHFVDYLDSHGFCRELRAEDRQGVILQLSKLLAESRGLDSIAVRDAVLAREQLMATGIGMGVAVPHARIESLHWPVVAVGLSSVGIDFDAPDGVPAQIICLILTPQNDDGAQLKILADIAASFRHEHLREKTLQVGSYTEFLALIRSERRR